MDGISRINDENLVDDICIQWSNTKLHDKIVSNPDLTKFPIPYIFNSKDDYANACTKWSLGVLNSFPRTILPLPINLNVNRPPKPNDIQFTRNKVLNKNHILELTEFLFSGTDFDEKTKKFSPQPRYEDIFLCETLSKERAWGTTLVPQMPRPELFDTYEEYRLGLIEWKESLKKILDEKNDKNPNDFKSLLELEYNKDKNTAVYAPQYQKDANNTQKNSKIQNINPQNIKYLLDDYLNFIMSPINIKPQDSNQQENPVLSDIIKLLEKRVTTESEKNLIIKYIVQAIKNGDAEIFTQIFMSVPIFWKVVETFRWQYCTDFVINPVFSGFNDVISKGTVISNFLLFLSRFHLSQIFTFILTEHFACADTINQLNFSKELLDMYSSQYEDEIRKFFDENISAENVECATIILRLMLWSKKTKPISNIFKTLASIYNISPKQFNSVVHQIFVDSNSFFFYYEIVSSTNFDSEFFINPIVKFTIDYFNLARPELFKDALKPLLRSITQCTDIVVQRKSKIYSELIRSICKFAKRYYVIKRVDSQEVFPAMLVLLYTLGVTHIEAAIKLELLGAFADLAVFPTSNKILSANRHQFEIILCNSIFSEDMSFATWKFITTIVINHASQFKQLLKESNIPEIFDEIVSAPISRKPIVISLARIIMSFSPTTAIIPQDLFPFLELLRPLNIDFKTDFRIYAKNRPKTKMKMLYKHVKRRPISKAIFAFLKGKSKEKLAFDAIPQIFGL